MGLMRPADMAAEDRMKEAERRATLRSRSGSDGSCALVAEADLAPTLQMCTTQPWKSCHKTEPYPLEGLS